MPSAFATVDDVASYGGQFLALAALLALIGVVAARSAARQARATRPGAARRGWSGLAAVAVGGTTVWAAHIIDLVGWRPAATGSFDPASAALSLSMAIAAAAGGLAVAGSGPTDPGRVAAGAAIFGAGAWTADVLGPSAVALVGAGPRPIAALPALVPAIGAALVSLLVVLRGTSGGWATVGVVASGSAWSATHLLAAATVGRSGVAGPAGTRVSSAYGFTLVAVVLLATAVIVAIIVGAVAADRKPAPVHPRPGPRELVPAPRAAVGSPRFPSRVGPARPGAPSGADRYPEARYPEARYPRGRSRYEAPPSGTVRYFVPSPMPARYFEMDTVELPTVPGMAPRPTTGGPQRGGRRWYRIRPYADPRPR